MKTLVVLYHPVDRRYAHILFAELRRLLDANQYRLWTRESRTAFGDAPEQLEEAISAAWAVLVLVGSLGVDQEFLHLAQGAIHQRIINDSGRFGRLRLQLPRAVDPPSALQRWVALMADEYEGQSAVAEEILDKLNVQPHWSVRLALDKAAEHFEEGMRSELRKHLTDVAQALADGKPLTFLIGPYAGVEGQAEGSCPSQIRQDLLGLINDKELRDALAPLQDAADIGLVPPLLWQDHLATLCLLFGRTRDEIAYLIEQAVSKVAGDLNGPPDGIFRAVADFVQQLSRFGPKRSAGLPTVTILTVCPGLRMERALISRNVGFERNTLLLDSQARPEVHGNAYKPSPILARRALMGEEHFMPPPGSLPPADEVEFVRVIKLSGSRDIDRGIASGDLGQAYNLVGQLRPLLEDFVAAAGSGPYIVLGGGLSTPPLQAAHAVLLRNALEKPERRPRLALVPRDSASVDRLRQVERDRAAGLTKVPHSGFDRLQVVSSEPVNFVEALSIAFGFGAREEVA